MHDPRIVLITGVSRRLGARLATLLQADPDIARVIGVDTEAPATSLGRTEFVRADIRTPAIAELIDSAGVDTVVHTGLVTAPGRAGGRGRMKEINVIGTIQLLAACQRAPAVRRLVARSTTVVYGSSPHAPALFTEGMEPALLPRHGYAKDAWDVEGYVRGFARRRPDVSVSTLRFASFIGPGVDSPLTRYFALPVVPTVFGFDPRLQFVHEDDGLEALRRMTMEDHPGTFNVSGEGVMMLSQAIRRAGRVGLPVPGQHVRAGGEFLRFLGCTDFSPEQAYLLSHGRAVDTAAVQAELGWRPAYTTVGAFDDFVRRLGPARSVPAGLFDRMADVLAGQPGATTPDAFVGTSDRGVGAVPPPSGRLPTDGSGSHHTAEQVAPLDEGDRPRTATGEAPRHNGRV